MKQFLVPSSKGLIVRDPISMQPLSEKGAMKPWTGPQGRYWRKRLRVGDVIIGKPQSSNLKIEKQRNQGKEN